MNAKLIADAAYKFAQSRANTDNKLKSIIEYSFILGAYYMYDKLK